MANEEKFDMDKNKDYSEWYTEVLKRAELIDIRYPVKGFIVHMPNAAVSETAICDMFAKALERTGHKRAMFPSVVPESFFKTEAEHAKGFSAEVFWITHGSDTQLPEKIALRPTSETIMYSMFAQWIKSWRDLPLKIYQQANVWRYETKATRPLLRDREFYWIEAHDCYGTKAEAERQVLEDLQMTTEIIHDKLGVPFFFFKRPAWDKFPGAEYTFGTDALLPNGKIIQLPSTHLLSQNLTKGFNVKYVDQKEKENYAWQTCYGPAHSRIYAALILTHGDNKGVVLPFDVAATQVVIIPIPKKGKEGEVLDYCRKLYQHLLKLGIRVELDASDKSPGYKFNNWELKGAALRFEVGMQEVDKKEITVARRDTGEKTKVNYNDIEPKFFENISEKMLHTLKERADEYFKNSIHEAKNLQEITKIIDTKGGYVRVAFCSRDKDGEKCADKIQEACKAEVRGTIHGKEEFGSASGSKHQTEKATGKCVICGKKANAVVYVAKAY